MVRGPTRATIHLAAIRANFEQARRCAEGREPIAVVKADAYGHGAIRVARSLQQAGCRWYAVASVAEAAALREAEISEPVLVLSGASDAEEGEAVVGLDLTPVVHHEGDVDLTGQHSHTTDAAQFRRPTAISVWQSNHLRH